MADRPLVGYLYPPLIKHSDGTVTNLWMFFSPIKPPCLDDFPQHRVIASSSQDQGAWSSSISLPLLVLPLLLLTMSMRLQRCGGEGQGKQRSHGQWEFQDPKMEVLYHIRPYFVGKFPYIALENRPYIW